LLIKVFKDDNLKPQEILKFKSPDAYPQYRELENSLLSIKRVVDRINEMQRREENKTLKANLIEMIEDWQVHLIVSYLY
jgi:cell division control protein 24